MRNVLSELVSTCLVACAIVLCAVGITLTAGTPAYAQYGTVCPEGDDAGSDHCKGTCPTAKPNCNVGRDNKCICQAS